MARTKGDIERDIQWEQDRLDRTWELYQNSLRIIENSTQNQLRGQDGFGKMAVYAAQGM